MTESNVETKKFVVDGVDHTISWYDDCNTCMKQYYTIMEAMEECVITIDTDNEHRREVIYDLKDHVKLTHSDILLQMGADHKCFYCGNVGQGKCENCDKYMCYNHHKCCGACGENLCQEHNTTPCKENENHMFV